MLSQEGRGGREWSRQSAFSGVKVGVVRTIRKWFHEEMRAAAFFWDGVRNGLMADRKNAPP